jgi:hypothetical protein
VQELRQRSRPADDFRAAQPLADLSRVVDMVVVSVSNQPVGQRRELAREQLRALAIRPGEWARTCSTLQVNHTDRWLHTNGGTKHCLDQILADTAEIGESLIE